MTRRPALAALPAALLAAGAAAAAAQPPTEAVAAPDGPTRLLRTPSASAAHIAFAYAGNVWIVDRAGGAARRLTSTPGEATNPKLSPDGRWVAYSADIGGNTDVYVVPALGGEPRRLTWHPGADAVQGWTPDGRRVVFASGRATSAPTPVPRFWTVALGGGPEAAMPMPRAYQGKISPDGRRVAYRMPNSWDEERRNYRGGQNRPVWVLDLRTLAVETVPWTDSKELDPVWVGDHQVYFLSDRDGVQNVWAYDTRTRQVRQVTRYRDLDVKSLDATPTAVVFEQGGVVHELDPATGRDRVVPITAAGDFPWMMPQWKDVSGRVTALAISPTGRRAAVEARGEIFTIPAEKGDARNVTRASGSAERDPAWSPDGRFVAYFGDRSGEYRLYIAPQDGVTPPREIALPSPTHYYTPAWSPDGRRLAYTDADFRVWTLDVASGRATVVDQDTYLVPRRELEPVWSPDGRWLAYAKRLPSLYRAVFVANVETGEKRQLTDGLADATAPAWDASGKYLWFLASTNYALTSQWLDMSSYERPVTRALYLAVLAKGEPSPLLPESDEEASLAGAAPSPQRPGEPQREDEAARRAATRARVDSARADTTRGGDSTRAPARSGGRPVRIDFDGMRQRVLAVAGVAARDYAGLRAGAPGTVFFLETVPSTGTAEAPGGAGGALHRYTLRDRRAVPFAANVAQFVVSADGRKLLYRTPAAPAGPGAAPAGPPAGTTLFLVDADKAPAPGASPNAPPSPGASPAPGPGGGAPGAAAGGRLAVSLRMWLDPRAEFAQIFREGWRNQRDYLYVKNMQGADWPAAGRTYGALLPHVRHRADLNYLLDWMGSEIAVGHSYVRGGDLPETGAGQPGVGLLGADLAVENGRHRIRKIYDAESWNPDLRAPLAGPGVDVRPGDYVLAVNGTELRGEDNLDRLLDGTANRQTVLLVNGRPTAEGARRVTVLPVASEAGLRARAWVEGNRRLVDSLSGGRLAYVHLPNTGQPGYQSFNRYYFAQQDRQGAVIDERYNGGGSAADYIIDLLGRSFDGYFNSAVNRRTPFTSPSAGIWGPKVMIINEMAGSGGDLMPYMFKTRKIGPLVGERTWGGLVHTADTPLLVDGGSMIAPRGGFFTRQGRWAIENEGVAPDIRVETWPREVAAGRDPQLERAVQEALRLLAEHPVDRRTAEPPPPTWGRRAPAAAAASAAAAGAAAGGAP
jgi:tricorn protease